MNILCWKPNCLTQIYFNLFAQHKKCRRLMLTKDFYDTDLNLLTTYLKIKTFKPMPCSWIEICFFTLIILDNLFNIGSQAFTEKKYFTACKRISSHPNWDIDLKREVDNCPNEMIAQVKFNILHTVRHYRLFLFVIDHNNH